MITLYRPGTEEAIAGISLWRCTYSAYGEGFALVLWCDPSAVAMLDLPASAVFADNAAMAQMVMMRFNQYQDGYQGRGLRASCLSRRVLGSSSTECTSTVSAALPTD
jgi:hypothetical protein